jgi:hypothetical protein
MSNKRNQSTRLQALLAGLKSDQTYNNPPLTNEYVDYEPQELTQYRNAYQLYTDISMAIKCESDLATVREIALYYLDTICQEMPDIMAHRISQRILG